MPRLTEGTKTAYQKLREYARNNRGVTSYDVSYHLTAAALAADGQGVPAKPDYVRSLSELTPEHKAQYDAAMSGLGLVGGGA